MFDDNQNDEVLRNLSARIRDLEKTQKALVFGNWLLWGAVLGLLFKFGMLF